MQFGQRDHAEENSILIDRLHPANHTWIWPRLHPFGNRVGIEKKVHRLIFRRGALSRRTFRFDPRNGDPAKNSARLPARFVFRCHSSAPTTTAAVRPFLVIVCGPSDIARSMISLNFALACHSPTPRPHRGFLPFEWSL